MSVTVVVIVAAFEGLGDEYCGKVREDESLYKEDSVTIYNTPELIGSFFPNDAKSISFFIKREIMYLPI